MAFLPWVNLKQCETPRQKGQIAEKLAKEYLCAQGLQFLTANYHGRRGEIDLIMRDGDTIVFVEVRFRREHALTSALESINPHKIHCLLLAAHQYLQQSQLRGIASRIDIVAVSAQQNQFLIDWIPNAITDEGNTWR